ncbi:hypothetical protein CPB84DRAFT_566117 [Gymnopilus junonius]|uniref:Uncharacterized protein n=1 Tax=Gymnopilus junonius TaxID=109634 RepID=A0A9P5TRI8_GYMJU|nr:hypothetical protein CPB84DRAFT_566117 [Gymnopilus junonius]
MTSSCRISEELEDALTCRPNLEKVSRQRLHLSSVPLSCHHAKTHCSYIFDAYHNTQLPVLISHSLSLSLCVCDSVQLVQDPVRRYPYRYRSSTATKIRRLESQLISTGKRSLRVSKLEVHHKRKFRDVEIVARDQCHLTYSCCQNNGRRTSGVTQLYFRHDLQDQLAGSRES